MDKELRILILEDLVTDAEMTEHELRKGGIVFLSKRVATKKAYLKALKEFLPELIISDHSLPQFDGLSALLIAKQESPEVPFILVSGAIGEELAIELLKKGATDYILKDRMSRLVPAVKRALQEAEESAKRQSAEKALRESEEIYRNVVERATDGITIIQDGTIKFVNNRLAELWGGFVEEMVGTPFTDYIYHDVLAEMEDRYRRRMAGEKVSSIYETILRRKDGGKVYAEINAGIILYEGRPANLVIIRNVTERKQAEEQTKVINALLQFFAQTSSRKEYLDTVVDLLRSYSNCQNVGIRILNAQGDIPYESTVGFRKEFLDSEGLLSINKDKCVCIRIIKEKLEPSDLPYMTPSKSFRCDNTSKFFGELSEEKRSQYRGVCVQKGFSSAAIIPIKYREKMIGAIHLADEKEGKVPQKLIESIELLASFIGEAIHRFNLEEEIYDNYFKESTINMILSLSLENISFNKLLIKTLKMVLAIPWLSFESKGSISLVGDAPEVLEMKAHNDISESQQKLCAKVPFGKCLCGRAALTQKIEFADHIDECHEICHEGMSPHGHYAVPILFGGRTLGVINIYLDEGHVRNKKEEEFLLTVADTLAGIILRRKAEDKIEYLAYYDELTGLPNRNLFIDRVTQGIARAEYSKKLCCSHDR